MRPAPRWSMVTCLVAVAGCGPTRPSTPEPASTAPRGAAVRWDGDAIIVGAWQWSVDRGTFTLANDPGQVIHAAARTVSPAHAPARAVADAAGARWAWTDGGSVCVLSG